MWTSDSTGVNEVLKLCFQWDLKLTVLDHYNGVETEDKDVNVLVR